MRTAGPRPPDDPDFYRRVLDHAPAPVLVVDPSGTITYANGAIGALIGREVDEVIGSNMVEHLHPDDLEWITDAFARLVETPDAAHLETHTPWAAIHLRLRDADGSPVAVQVTGHGGVHDDDVHGVIYDVREARAQELLGEVLRGIAAGESVEDLLALVMEMIVVQPLDVDAAILQPDDDGRFRVVASTTPELATAFDTDDAPWSATAKHPSFHPVAGLGGPLRDALQAAGYVDLWHVAVESLLGASTFRIVVVAPVHHEPATGVVDRLRRASELAGVVLLRSQTDDMLAHAASHDHLTRLPNRAGFHDRVQRLRSDDTTVVVLYIDLDGFKAINDRHGHQAGDRVLAVIADRLRAATRPGDLVARLGGDEFVVVLEPIEPRDDGDRRDPVDRGRATAERIVDLVGEAIELDDDILVGVAASVGVAIADAASGIDEILADADAAMYAAKRAGGNRLVSVLDPDGRPVSRA